MRKTEKLPGYIKLDRISLRFVILLLVVVPLSVLVASRMKIGSASAFAWLPEGRPERIRYEQFVEKFGSDQFLLVSWEGCTTDDPRLEQLKIELQNRNRDQQIFIDIQTGSELKQLLTTGPLHLSDTLAAKRLRGVLMGPDGITALTTRVTDIGLQNQKETIELVRSSADAVAGLGRNELKMVGPVYEGFAVDEAAEDSLKRLVLPSCILGVVLAWICLRKIRAALAVLLLAGIGQLLAVAMVTLSGGVFSAVLIVLPTLVFMLTLSAAVHFMNYYHDVSMHHSDKLGARAIMLGVTPSILATVTTAMGMIALATSQLAPVRTFGLYSASSLIIASTVLILAFPWVSDLFCGRKVKEGEFGKSAEPEDDDPTSLPVETWALRYASWVNRNSLWMIGAGVLCMAISFYGLLHLKSSTKFDDMFPKESKTVKDMAWIEKNLGPIASVEILLHFPNSANAGEEKGKLDSITESNELYEQWLCVDHVATTLNSDGEIGGVFSPSTFLPRPPQSGRARDVAKRSILKRELSQAVEQLSTKGMVHLSAKENVWRVTAKVSALSKLDYGQLTRHVEGLVNGALQQYASIVDSANTGRRGVDLPRVQLTGLSPIMHDTQLALLDDLGASFSVAFLLITPIMILIAKSLRNGLLIMIPNVLPETLVFDSMAWAGYSIDIAGILTASVAMGIAVNDTLHFVNWYALRLKSGDSRETAIADTFSNCARPMIHTMLISCCSMVPFMFADFNPTRQFAILMIAMMSSSILGDLFLLPALLLSPIAVRQRKIEIAESAELSQST